ncbi:S-layer homology domain-containing protein [Paenibacillus spiritus]|uniref:S-layer homology domain-containing protein n=1 Tax=Paenibacillus spiritus TaxID=2496557 RepID=A0A5J5GGC2_9BACL|nr:S-layer homology domain-containing protein [Paenibacillus spiritus]KAA9006564.1 S-layer homology domain-containing protein [Paenibacillus spiritus]
MYRKRQKKWIYASLIAMCISLIAPWGGTERGRVASAEPAATEATLDVGSPIRDMILDESRKVIYATIPGKNKLLFIDPVSMSVVKELAVGSQPTDMDQEGNKLYVALSGATLIAEVNLDTRQVSRNWVTKDRPTVVAVDGNSLFYSNGDQWCNIRLLNLTNLSDTIIGSRNIYSPRLAIDRENHRLFVGSIGISQGEVSAYSSVYGEQLWTYEPVGGYDSGILYQEGTLFYGVYSLNPSDHSILKMWRGGSVAALDSGYVYLNNGDIYTRDEQVKVYSSSGRNGHSLIQVDAARNVYKVGSGDSSISRMAFMPPSNPQAVSYSSTDSRIDLNQEITAWAAGEGERYVYAISRSSNRLLQIDTEQMQIVADRFVGSQPTDIVMKNGVLYISLYGSSYIAKIDTRNESEFMARIQPIEVGEQTENIALIGNKVYYSSTVARNKHLGVVDSTYAILSSYFQYSPKLSAGPDDKWLWIGESDRLSKWDTHNNRVIESSSYLANSGQKAIHDGNYVYYGGARYSAEQLSVKYGEYKYGPNTYERDVILDANEDIVLGMKGIYDRDTFQQLYAPPFKITSGLLLGDGSMLVGTFNWDASNPQTHIFHYGNLEEMRDNVQKNLAPSHLYAYDDNSNPLHFEGAVYFEPGVAALSASYYIIKLYDAQGVDRYSAYAYNSNRQSDGSFLTKIYASLSQRPVKIGVIPVISNADGDFVRTDLERMTHIWEADDYFVQDLALFDSDPSKDSIGGRVTFGAARDNSPSYTYRIYFFGDEGFIGEPLAVLNGGKSSYQFDIPQGTPIPQGAYALGVVLADDAGIEAPDSMITEVLDRMSKTPDLSQITVTNNASGPDQVEVKGLTPGDQVNLYDYQGKLLGELKVGAAASSVLFNGLTLNNNYPLVVVSVTTPPLLPSFYVYVEYKASFSGNPGGGSAGGGGGSGGGGSIGGGIGGGGGGSTIGIPSKTADSNGKLAITSLVKIPNFPTIVTATLSDEALSAALSKWSGNDNRLVIPIVESAETMTLTVKGSQLDKISGRDKSAVIDIQGTDKGLILPVRILMNMGIDNSSSLSLTVSAASASMSESIRTLLGKSSLNLAGQPYRYSLTKMSADGHNNMEYTSVNQYIGHVFYLPVQNGVTENNLSAVMVDETSGEWITVPATFVREGDKIKVTAYRQGNSTYAAVIGDASFTDVPSSHFASNAIGKLGVRRVIAGYADGSFKPEGTITRAEAASLLVKALGLDPSLFAGSSGGFKDVASAAWYSGPISAAVQAGLLKGYPDNTFRPNQTITQQEMVSIISNALAYANYSPGASAPSAALPASSGYKAWSSEAVATLLNAGVLRAQAEEFALQAGKTTTRAESALLIYRMLLTLKMI